MDNMIGQRIKNRRKELHITQTQIQEAAGISSGNLSGIENGRYLPSTSALLGLSKILDCSIDWILTGDSLKSTNFEVSNISEDVNKDALLKYYLALSKADQEELLMIAQMKYNRTQKEEKRTQKSSSLVSESSTHGIA